MVSRTRITRKELPRDEHVARGMEAAQGATHAPYEYKLKWKSGTGRSRTEIISAQNRLDLFARMISEHAEEGRDFFVWNISRALRYQAKARDY